MADIKKNVNINVNTKGAKKATQELTNVNDAINKTGKGSRTLDRNLKGNASMSANASKNFSKQAQGMQGVLVPAYAEVAARVFALTAAYNALVKAADFSILLQGQQLYAERTGRNLGIVAKQLQEAAGYMLDFSDASRAAGLSGTAGLTTDQMVQMTKAARTASIALGVGMEDAFSRLTRGIVKGEPEILDEIGVLMRLDKVYEDYGKTLNKNAKNLTESEKLQARFAFATGQITTNMGDLSSEVDSNPFARIGAQSRDALVQVGSVLAKALGPVATFFDEFKEGIYLVMALVTRSLIGKIFPAFEKFGEKIQTAAKQAQAAAKRSQAAFNQADANYASMAGRGAIAARGTAKTRQLMTTEGFVPGVGIQQAVADKDLKAQRKALEAAAGRAQAQLDRGGKLNKKFQIQSETALRAVQQRVNELTIEINKMGNASQNAARLTTKMAAGMQAGWNSVRSAVATYKAEVVGAIAAARAAYMDQGLIGGLKSVWANAMTSMGGSFSKFSQLVTGGLTVIGSSVTRMLSKGLSVFSAVAMAGFLIDSVIGASKKFSKSAAAANALKDSLGSVVQSLNKGENRLDLNLANTFTEAVANVNFKANLATQLSDAFESSMKEIDLANGGGLLDQTAKFLDGIKGIFGMGIADTMAESFESGMSALNKMGAGINHEGITNALQDAFTAVQYNPETNEFYQQIDRNMLGVINRFKEGKATFADVKAAAEELDSKGLQKINNVLEEIAERSKIFALAQKEIAKQTNDSSAAVGKLSKAFADLARSMTIKTDFDAFRDGVDASVTSFKQLSVDTIKFQQIIEQLGGTNALPQQLQGLETAQKGIARANKELAAAENRGDLNAEAAAMERIADFEKLKAKALQELREEDFLGKYTAEDFRADIVKRLGGTDPEELVKAQLKLTERQAKLKREIALFDRSSMLSIADVKERQKQVLENEQKILLAKEEYLKATQEGKLTTNQQADFEERRYNLLKDMLALEADKTRELEIQARLRGYEVTQVEKIANKMAMFMAEENGFTNASALINTEILIKQGEILAETTRQTAKYFKDALDKVSDAFRSSVEDLVVGYATGEQKDPFRETLGKGFVSAGAAGIAELTTRGVMGRNGLLGTAVKGLIGDGGEDPNSLFNLIFPKTQEEILIDQLKELKKLNRLIAGDRRGTKEFVVGNDRGEIVEEDLLDMANAGSITVKDAIEDAAKPFTESIEDSLKTSFRDITGDLGGSLESIFDKGIDGFGDIFSSFDLGLGNLFGMSGGLFGGPNGLFSMGSNLISSLIGGIDFAGIGNWFGEMGLGSLFLANGGYAKGGFRAFANGGITTQPTLGMIGEGKYNEAVVPLPDGKSIPVIGNTGGATNNVTVNVSVDSNGQAQSDTQGGGNMKELGYQISQVVQEEIMRQQRPGGLLNTTGTRSY